MHFGVCQFSKYYIVYGVYRLEIAKVIKSQDNKMNDPVM